MGEESSVSDSMTASRGFQDDTTPSSSDESTTLTRLSLASPSESHTSLEQEITSGDATTQGAAPQTKKRKKPGNEREADRPSQCEENEVDARLESKTEERVTNGREKKRRLEGNEDKNACLYRVSALA